MPSYKNLAIIALAASSVSVSPVLCAPTRSSSKRATEAPRSQAIAELEGRTPGERLANAVRAPGIATKVVLGLGSLGAASYLYDNVIGNNQRDVSPQMVAALNDLAERADDSDPPEDSDTILHLLVRALDELD